MNTKRWASHRWPHRAWSDQRYPVTASTRISFLPTMDRQSVCSKCWPPIRPLLWQPVWHRALQTFTRIHFSAHGNFRRATHRRQFHRYRQRSVWKMVKKSTTTTTLCRQRRKNCCQIITIRSQTTISKSKRNRWAQRKPDPNGRRVAWRKSQWHRRHTIRLAWTYRKWCTTLVRDQLVRPRLVRHHNRPPRLNTNRLRRHRLPPHRRRKIRATKILPAKFAAVHSATSTCCKIMNALTPAKNRSPARYVISVSPATITWRRTCVCTPAKSHTIAITATENSCKWPICDVIYACTPAKSRTHATCAKPNFPIQINWNLTCSSIRMQNHSNAIRAMPDSGATIICATINAT